MDTSENDNTTKHPSRQYRIPDVELCTICTAELHEQTLASDCCDRLHEDDTETYYQCDGDFPVCGVYVAKCGDMCPACTKECELEDICAGGFSQDMAREIWAAEHLPGFKFWDFMRFSSSDRLVHIYFEGLRSVGGEGDSLLTAVRAALAAAQAAQEVKE